MRVRAYEREKEKEKTYICIFLEVLKLMDILVSLKFDHCLPTDWFSISAFPTWLSDGATIAFRAGCPEFRSCLGYTDFIFFFAYSICLEGWLFCFDIALVAGSA